MKTNRATMFTSMALAFIFLGGSLASYSADSTPPGPDAKEFYAVPGSQMVWGETTNFLRADPSQAFRPCPTELQVGIRTVHRTIILTNNPAMPVNQASVYLRSAAGPTPWTSPSVLQSSSNWIVDIYLPPEKDKLAISMTDSNGAPVPKTTKGLELEHVGLKPQSYWRKWTKNGCRGIALVPHQDYDLYPLDPGKYFSIEKTGLYKLSLTQRLYIVDTNSYLKAVDLPPVTVDVEVKD